MSVQVRVTKDLAGQRPIPTDWRQSLSLIVDCIRNGDFCLAAGIPGVPMLIGKVAKEIEENIASYGNVKLIELPEEAWDTSVCQWMGGYWDVLVDLYTDTEGASDLVLSVRVREASSSFVYEVLSVHVP